MIKVKVFVIFGFDCVVCRRLGEEFNRRRCRLDRRSRWHTHITRSSRVDRGRSPFSVVVGSGLQKWLPLEKIPVEIGPLEITPLEIAALGNSCSV